MNMRHEKGFIHTLEAVIATIVVVSFVIILMPSIQESSKAGLIERARMSGQLELLDRSGDISRHIGTPGANLSGLKDVLALKSNFSYGYSVGLASYAFGTAQGNDTAYVVSGGQNNITEVTVSVLAGSEEILPETVVWDSTGPKTAALYGTNITLIGTRINALQLELNFSGAEKYTYRIKKLEHSGTVPQDRATWVASYLMSGGAAAIYAGVNFTPSEVRVVFWRQ